MRKLSIALILVTKLSSFYAFAGCRSDSIIIGRSAALGLSFGDNSFSGNGFEGSMSNIPISGPYGAGCFVQSSKLTYSVESDSDSFEGKILIYPITGSFENVEDGSLNTYVRTQVIRNRYGNLQVNVGLLSTVCAGDQTLSVESFSGSLEDLIASSEANFNSRSTFATGKVAQALLERMPHTKGSLIPPLFLDLLTNTNIRDVKSDQTYVTPSVSVIESLDAGPISTSERFTTIDLNQGLCTANTQAVLEPFRIEKLDSQSDFLELDYSNWRGRGSISWKVSVP